MNKLFKNFKWGQIVISAILGAIAGVLIGAGIIVGLYAYTGYTPNDACVTLGWCKPELSIQNAPVPAEEPTADPEPELEPKSESDAEESDEESAEKPGYLDTLENEVPGNNNPLSWGTAKLEDPDGNICVGPLNQLHLRPKASLENRGGVSPDGRHACKEVTSVTIYADAIWAIWPDLNIGADETIWIHNEENQALHLYSREAGTTGDPTDWGTRIPLAESNSDSKQNLLDLTNTIDADMMSEDITATVCYQIGETGYFNTPVLCNPPE